MGEIKFVIKSMVVTVLVVLGLQTKVGKLTLEEHLEYWIHTSQLATTLQEVASGGVQALQHAGKATSEIVSKALGNNPHVQKASRLTFELKRSVQAEEEQKR